SVKQTLENSLDFQSPEEQEVLKEAVQAILQEEEQDMRWEGFQEKERPPWRPRRCKQNHEDLLERLVQRRMEEAQLDSSIEINSSLQQSIICKAKRLKEDLMKVATWVSSCYPEQENVCQLYATLYHKTFSARLREITENTLCDEDCVLLLQLVNEDYPKEVTKCLHKILEREETAWKEGELPQLRDQVYCCDQAIDVIQYAQKVLGDETKAQRITCQMRHFLTDYKAFHAKAMKSKQANTEAVLMVNLSCLIQCRDYITNKAHLFPEDVKTDCLSLLATMIKGSHYHFTSNMLKELKDLYRKVGSSEWLKDSEVVCEELLAKLDRHIQKFNNLDKMCCQELLGGMHKEFLAEYVRKMMKQKIKLSDKTQQQMAASSLCINSERIHTYFTAAGSNMDWLKDILPNLAGLLKLQDPNTIKLELAGLMKLYPDLSECHISAWLRLKGNLSPSNLKKILETITFSKDQLREMQDSLQFGKKNTTNINIK
uniref:Tumor necrosis factor, alpha-induced protein 2b n=1 Tax=Cyprinus carpio TaxID=7962 RepID=A0A8C1VEA9_CYPCA